MGWILSFRIFLSIVDRKSRILGFTIMLAYKVIVPMTTFNVWAPIRYLPRAFRVWTLKIVQLWTIWSVRSSIITESQPTGVLMHIEKLYFNYIMQIIELISLFCSRWSFRPLDSISNRYYQILHAEFYSLQFRLLGDLYACLLPAFNTSHLYLPFAKIVQRLAMPEFGGNDFVNNGALGDHRSIQSNIKPKVTKIDSDFITFIRVMKVKPFVSNISSLILY
jgi:hypothetical protein